MSFNGIKDMEIRKYYDIEYTATAIGASVQRVYLDDIDHDDFSEEALEDAKDDVINNPDVEGDLFGEWEMNDGEVEIQEWEEGDNTWECVLCKQMFIGGYGNNPEPVVNIYKPETFNARCCDACNTNQVIPARLKIAMECNELTKNPI